VKFPKFYVAESTNCSFRWSNYKNTRGKLDDLFFWHL